MTFKGRFSSFLLTSPLNPLSIAWRGDFKKLLSVNHDFALTLVPSPSGRGKKNRVARFPPVLPSIHRMPEKGLRDEG
jgi:hypothetical protein